MGIVMGSIVNLCLVGLGMVLIPPPGGLDLSDPEVLKRQHQTATAKEFSLPLAGTRTGDSYRRFFGRPICSDETFCRGDCHSGFLSQWRPDDGVVSRRSKVVHRSRPPFGLSDGLHRWISGGHLRRQSLNAHSNTGMTRQ